MGEVFRARDTKLNRDIAIESNTDYDVVSVDLATAVVTPAITTQRAEEQPPNLSPDRTRLIYRLITTGRPGGLWMSAVSGGPPVRLVKGSSALESQGSWSPDGNWYVYLSQEKGRQSLNKVKTTGQATPVVLKTDVKLSARGAMWSPANDWILYSDAGVKLISPDGQTTRDVSPVSALVYAFSADGRTIYGPRQPVRLGPMELFSMNVTGGSEKTIGSLARDYVPAASSNPGLRLSLTPDGKSLTYSITRTSSNLWLMDGLQSVRVRQRLALTPRHPTRLSSKMGRRCWLRCGRNEVQARPCAVIDSTHDRL